MRRLLGVIAVAFLVVGCGSKSAEEKAAEDAVKQLQQLFGTIDPSSVVQVEEDTARQWPTKFCSLEVNMTRGEVQAIMGTPTMTYRNQQLNQDQYEAWGYDLTIFYDLDDTARQIQQSSGTDVPCETKFRD